MNFTPNGNRDAIQRIQFSNLSYEMQHVLSSNISFVLARGSNDVVPLKTDVYYFGSIMIIWI